MKNGEDEAAKGRHFGSLLSRLVLLVACIGLMSGVTLPLTLGLLEPGYDASRQYISELGADGASRASLMNLLGFWPAGLSFILAMAYFAFHWKLALMRVGCIFMMGVGIGYIGAALFPCDAGCPAVGSFKQAMHNLTGLFEYGGAMIGLALLLSGLLKAGSKLRAALTGACFVCVALGFLMMLSASLNTPFGAWQRLADYALFVWLFVMTFLSVKYEVG